MAAERRALRPMLSNREPAILLLRLDAVLVALTVDYTVGWPVSFWRRRRTEMLP